MTVVSLYDGHDEEVDPSDTLQQGNFVCLKDRNIMRLLLSSEVAEILQPT